MYPPPLTWEVIDTNHHRAKVFGGWLVKAYEDVIHDKPEQGMVSGWDWRVAMCFVPDPEYKWEVETKEMREIKAEEDSRLEKRLGELF